MNTLILFASAILFGVISADSKVSFNSNDKCGPGRSTPYSKTIGKDDIITVQFRKPTSILHSVTDECTLKFQGSVFNTFSKPRLEVRFDSTNRYINDPDVRLEFYASDEVKVDKKIREISKSQPLGKPGNDTIKTSGSFLTIRGIRSVEKSTNYNVEFTIRASSAATARWSLISVAAAVIVRYM